MQNGLHDQTVPVAANRVLYDAAQEPKHIDWYDAGHNLPLDQVAPKALAWFDKYL
jgi:hypothetical protein